MTIRDCVKESILHLRNAHILLNMEVDKAFISGNERLSEELEAKSEAVALVLADLLNLETLIK